MEPKELKDEHGSVIMATIQTYGDNVHTFVQRVDYDGPFLPGFQKATLYEPFNELVVQPNFIKIDHIASNFQEFDMEPTADWYEKMLDFHRFYSVDYNTMHTEYSALRSTVITDYDEVIKFALAEPAEGKRRSQVQEYIDYYGGPGVQHIAL